MEGVTVVTHPLVQHKLTFLRDKNRSTKSFRELCKEIGVLLCYEVTRDLPMTAVDQCRNRNATHAHVIAADRRKEACFCADSSSRHNIRGRHARSRASCTCRAYRALPRSQYIRCNRIFFQSSFRP